MSSVTICRKYLKIYLLKGKPLREELKTLHMLLSDTPIHCHGGCFYNQYNILRFFSGLMILFILLYIYIQRFTEILRLKIYFC